MADYSAFYRYLTDERKNQRATANHIVNEAKRLEAWLHQQQVFDLTQLGEAESRVWLNRYLCYLAGYPNGQKDSLTMLPTKVRRSAQRLRIWFEYEQATREYVRANPFDTLIAPQRPKHRTSNLSRSEMDKIVQMVLTESREHDRTRNWAIISVMFHTELFPSELAQLRESHLGMVKGLPVQIAYGDAQPALLPADAAAALQQWLRERRDLLIDVRRFSADASLWLVTSGERRGQDLHHRALSSLFSRYQTMAKRHGVLDPTVDVQVQGQQVPYDANTRIQAFYGRRRRFMLELLQQSKTLWAGAAPSRAIVLQETSGRHLYGHAVYQLNAPGEEFRKAYAQLQAQQQSLFSALSLHKGSRKLQLPHWYDDLSYIEIESAVRVVSERFRRTNLIGHYQKVEEDASNVQMLLSWLDGLEDEYLRVRKRFLNFYVHITNSEMGETRKLLLPDVGIIVTGEVKLTMYEKRMRATRADKIALTPDFTLDNADFYLEGRWERAKATR